MQFRFRGTFRFSGEFLRACGISFSYQTEQVYFPVVGRCVRVIAGRESSSVGRTGPLYLKMAKCCYVCGVLGFKDLLIKCTNCKSAFIHVYCRKTFQCEIPDDWACENCHETPKNVPGKSTRIVPVLKRPVKFITPNEAAALASQPSLSMGRKHLTLPEKACKKHEITKRRVENLTTMVPLATSPERSDLHAHCPGGHPAKDKLNASKNVREQKLSDGQWTMDRYLPNHPASHAIWKGNIRTNGFAPPVTSCDDVWGYPPAIVGRKAFEFLKKMPDVLDFKAIPRCIVWTSMFDDNGPDKNDIGLYLFPIRERSKQYYSSLVSQLEEEDIVLKSCIHGVQLLVFSSSCLDEKSKKIHEANYLWGLFVPLAINFKEPEPKQLPLSRNAEPAIQHVAKIEQNVDMETDMLGEARAGKSGFLVARDSYCSCSKTSAATQPVPMVQPKLEKYDEDDTAYPLGSAARVAQGVDEEPGKRKYKKVRWADPVVDT